MSSTHSKTEPGLGATQPVELPELEARGGDGPSLLSSGSALLDSIGVSVSVVVGPAHTTVGNLMKLKEADLLKIERGVDQPVDIIVNGNLVARGQLVVVDDNFGVRVTEVALSAKA